MSERAKNLLAAAAAGAVFFGYAAYLAWTLLESGGRW